MLLVPDDTTVVFYCEGAQWTKMAVDAGSGIGCWSSGGVRTGRMLDELAGTTRTGHVREFADDRLYYT